MARGRNYSRLNSNRADNKINFKPHHFISIFPQTGGFRTRCELDVLMVFDWCRHPFPPYIWIEVGNTKYPNTHIAENCPGARHEQKQYIFDEGMRFLRSLVIQKSYPVPRSRCVGFRFQFAEFVLHYLEVCSWQSKMQHRRNRRMRYWNYKWYPKLHRSTSTST